MNTKQLKAYAPQARRDFIAAVTDRAAILDLTAEEIGPVTQEGDVAVIAGRAYPKEIAAQRGKLVERIRRDGFDRVMEAMAYTWFNRLAAIRYMELHGYLEHGYRVLSHPEGRSIPEILEHATAVDLVGLDRAKVVELKLDGTQDEELYRLLLLEQCHALHRAMPFLFEELDDETELLLPDGLLRTDSLIRQLVESIEESAWEDIEIIGWLYQFYISEKKDKVIGKVVKSEDIPAATQLFTPNWIVKYMVQNSLGAQWLATYPQSPLKGQMEYYIEPAEQTEEVNAQLAAITPSQLNPEELTLVDPASGSGHILVEAYELFKAIYLERGYRRRDVPQLILEKNLFGLDIDERAAQLTGFALMMKGRADNRRLFELGVKLNVMALVDSAGFDAEGLAKGVELSGYGLKPGDLTELKRLFEHATTFGSLIEVPEAVAETLPALKLLIEATGQILLVSEEVKRLRSLVKQAELLAARYDAVVANPPYMGSKGMDALVKSFTKDRFPDAKNDLFACFIERSYSLAKHVGQIALVTMQSWMFLSSFERLRDTMLSEKTVTSMVQIGFNSFPSLNSKVAQATVFSLKNTPIAKFMSSFIDLNSAPPSADKNALFLAHDPMRLFQIDCAALRDIPASRIAYWASKTFIDVFRTTASVANRAVKGLDTGGNIDRFLRRWFEPSAQKNSCMTPDADHWFPIAKGGNFRRWYGNNEFVINYGHQGRDLRENRANLRSRGKYFETGLTWTVVSVDGFAVRLMPAGFLFDQAGSAIFRGGKDDFELEELIASLNSVVTKAVSEMLSPTISFTAGDIRTYPIQLHEMAGVYGRQLIAAGKEDWDAYESSWEFQSFPILTASSKPAPTLEASYTAWITQNRNTITEMKRLEEENNRLFIDAYGLADELAPDVPIEQITLTVNPAYRYRGKLTEEEQWARFRHSTMKELISYAIGCMMGRYSLDLPGLIYAHSGNEGFDPSRYPTFAADDDGIVPLTATEWFDDDAAHRLIEFISVAWDARHLEENLTFLADNLSPKKNESSRKTIRRYLCDRFFKDHLKTYKKRPIYWLFSTGKQKAFHCLVYLHRYNEGTLGRMRTEYVIPLQGRMASRIQRLEDDIAQAASTSHRKKLEKERDSLLKQRVELLAFDEKLRHHADRRIHLELDDGVKVNYGKFGDLLAEVKAVTGKAAG